MDLYNVTEEVNKINPTYDQKGYFSIMLISMAFLSRALMTILSEYDTWFKVLSIASLIIVCLVNGIKLVEQIINGIKILYASIKSISYNKYIKHFKIKK